ncbi:MAG: hypothetical protein NT018_06720 [Armatimonadetes bacterium]|nr:hypothetical protein [Armatimonadota bacterium]
MRRVIFLALVLTLAISACAMAARVTSTKIQHFNQVYQAYCANSICDDPTAPSCPQDQVFQGYLDPSGIDAITAAPGVLAIDPGGSTWPNFIQAAQAGISYTIKNTTLIKQTPEFVQCNDIFPSHRVPQQGTPNIRLWWPLMYEVPSTTFTLTILYGTPVLFDDDGAGPNPPSYVHVEEWIWHVDTDLDHLGLLLDLFHEVPFGKDEVPLISDEYLFEALKDKIEAANEAFEAGDTTTAAEYLTDFELEVMDACIPVSPSNPNPTGPGTGIAQTDENPACCKLLVDIEYILQNTGIGMPGK